MKRTKASNLTNPNWAGGPEYSIPTAQQFPDVPTMFDELVTKRRLQNHEEVWATDPVLYAFAQKHRHKRYVPEWLLANWGMKVNVKESDRL